MSERAAEILASFGGRLDDMRVIEDMDRALVELLRLRESAANLHSDTRPCPVKRADT